MPSPCVVREPGNSDEWRSYYDLRWRILRAPWGQPRGSERDDCESDASHRIILDDSQRAIAIGRLHFPDKQQASIRYMAVDEEHRQQGLGTQILTALETVAREHGALRIQLHARQSAVPFYLKRGYDKLSASHILYNEIQHYLMQKSL